MMGVFAGWHLLLIVAILVILFGVAIAVVVVVIAASRSAGRTTPAAAPSSRLRELDALRSAGQISDEEYARKRQEIIDDV